MNLKIKGVVEKSINILKKQYSQQQLTNIKMQLFSIYQGEFNVSESMLKMKALQIDLSNNRETQDAYYTLGSLISMPPRGPIKVLREAFDEGNTSVSKEFLEYQTEVIGYVYTQVQDIDKV